MSISCFVVRRIRVLKIRFISRPSALRVSTRLFDDKETRGAARVRVRVRRVFVCVRVCGGVRVFARAYDKLYVDKIVRLDERRAPHTTRRDAF